MMHSIPNLFGSTMNYLHPSLLALADDYLLPPQASNTAAHHDPVWNMVLITTTIFFVLVVALMFLFIFKYRRRPGKVPGPMATHNTPLEIAWTVIPLLIVLGFFFVGLKGYVWYDNPPSDAYTIIVRGSTSWKWTFYYPNGAISPYLYVPKSTEAKARPIRIQIETEPDGNGYLHGFYIPAYRIQRAAVPGRITQIWFEATELPPLHVGAEKDTPEEHYFDIFCTQYCGNGHSQMRSRVYVMQTEAEFQKKIADLANPFVDPETKKPLPMATVGEKLIAIYGCTSCHTMDAKMARGQGPPWYNLYKSDVTFSAPAGTPPLLATDSDEKWMAYLDESIYAPAAKIVSTYDNAMTNFAGQLSSDNPLDMKDLRNVKRRAIIEYLMSLDHNGPDGKPKYYKPMPTPTAAPGAASEPATTQAGK